MKATDIMWAGIAGTTAFTLFSYICSKTFDEDFEEPKLMGKMFDRISPDLNEQQAQFAGWLSHYLIGVAFAAGYKELIKTTGIKPSIRNGIIAGAVSGYPASLTWDTAFKLHPSPPRGRTWPYYLQLITGHAIFGAVSFLVLDIFKSKEDDEITETIPEDSADAKLSEFATAGS